MAQVFTHIQLFKIILGFLLFSPPPPPPNLMRKV
jgi:hypothetical protein